MNILESTIRIGLKKPISFLHVTDSHLPCTIPTEKDPDLRQITEDALSYCMAYAEEHNMTMLHTGDIMTYCNEKNLAFLDRLFNGKDFLFAVGNHDFCDEGVSEDDPNNFVKNLPKLSPHFPQNLSFDVRRYDNGFKVVLLFNGFFKITKDQLALLKKECEEETPIVLCMHVPLFTEEHAKSRMEKGNCAHLLGPSEEYLARYPEKFQFHRADQTTMDAISFIKSSPVIRAIIAGHTHMNYEETLENGAIQIVTGSSRFGYARVITLV